MATVSTAELDARIERLEAKLKQQKARRQQIEARRKAMEQKRVQAEATRTKILYGEALLKAIIVTKTWPGDSAETIGKVMLMMDRHITRPADREFLGLDDPELAETLEQLRRDELEEQEQWAELERLEEQRQEQPDTPAGRVAAPSH